MIRRARLAAMLTATILALILCAGCAVGCFPDDLQPSAEIGQQRTQGAAAARTDWDCRDAAICVFRQVAPGEKDPATGLPLRDGGTDAVSPAKAAWAAAYNSAIQRYVAAEGSPHTSVLKGTFPWNRHYAVRVATVASSNDIVAAKMMEYAPDGLMASVPQTATVKEHRISIIFDEHTDSAIGVAIYEFGRSLVHRDGKTYILISGREAELSSAH